MPSPIKALLDANVLYSNHLRNLLLQMAQNDLFDAKWSAMIEKEWLRNMEPRTRERIESRTLPLIRTWFAASLVAGFDPAREVGGTDAKDRHVASAAAAIAPCILVTDNPRHFDARALEDLGVTVRSPDEFLCDLFDATPDVVAAATRDAAANLTKTCPTWDEYLNSIANRCRLAKFAERLRKWTPQQEQAPHPA